MKQLSLAVALVLAAAATPSFAADVGVSVSINQPGLYGRIDIGQAPTPPVVVYEQPVVIVPAPISAQRQPIYLHVPPGHSRDWRRYCGRYSACGQPVYFVREDWYQSHYRPQHQPQYRPQPRPPEPSHGRGPERGHGRGHDRGHDRGDRHDGDRDDGRNDGRPEQGRGPDRR